MELKFGLYFRYIPAVGSVQTCTVYFVANKLMLIDWQSDKLILSYKVQSFGCWYEITEKLETVEVDS